MKRMIQAAIMFFMILAIAGCGGGGSPTTIVSPTIVTKIFSNQALDGDIADLSGARIVTQGMGLSPIVVQSVFAGIDPVTGEEFRAFLDFSLGSVPLNAVIVSAFLDITIDSIDILPPANSIPILVELVFLQPPTLFAADFDRAPLQPPVSVIFPVFLTDTAPGRHVLVDVKPLIEEAQFRRLDNFQIRISDGGTGFDPPGLIEINDTTGLNRNVLAPLLEVTYF